MTAKTLIIIATTTGDSTLEEEIELQYTTEFLKIRGVPKALLPVSGQPGLTWWYEAVRGIFKNVYIVTNAHNYKHYERWASGHDFPRENIVNTGFSQGAIADIALVCRVKNVKDEIVATLAELLYDRTSFGEALLTELGNNGNRILYYEDDSKLSVALSVNRQSANLATDGSTDALQINASPIAVVLDNASLQSLELYLSETNPLPAQTISTTTLYKNLIDFFSSRSTAHHAVHITSLPQSPILAYLNPTTTLSAYTSYWIKSLDHVLTPRTLLTQPSHQSSPIITNAYARVGLVGNPSDGFYGKTLSLLISNFWAQVTLIPNPLTQVEYAAITILPNPVADPHFFSSLASLARTCATDGYDNGDRLLQATCSVFHQHCFEKGIKIDRRQGFSVLFETNVPRQVGLAGSSAIITAFWRALVKFYGLKKDVIPPQVQASLVLSVEERELGISAGLQDRVIQAYGGCVFMDFDKKFVEENGFGKYERIDIKLIPKLWMAYVANPKDSGKMHNSVRQRWKDGEPAVLEAMRTFAAYTTEARSALESHDTRRFAHLMAENFKLRRAIYGEAALGPANLRMVELARQHQCVAKFPGSGGAVIGIWNGENKGTEQEDLRALRWDLEKEGFVFVELSPMGEQ